MSFQNKYDFNELTNKTVYFNGNDYNKVKKIVKNFITHLSKNNIKVFLLDSYWSKDYYNRFKHSRYLNEIERRYHLKISVEEFLNKDNIINYMNKKNTNIIKVKSIEGFMSAAELFPVIVSKIQENIINEKVYILINDFVLEHINEETLDKLIDSINTDTIKFIIISKRGNINKISKIIEVVRDG